MARELKQRTFTVPATSGSYAFERETFGEVGSGQAPIRIMGVTVSVDSTVAGMTVELWLPKAVGDRSTLVDGDYQYTGKSIGATGSETWALADYPGAQIRVKSGGTSGSAVLSVTAKVV